MISKIKYFLLISTILTFSGTGLAQSPKHTHNHKVATHKIQQTNVKTTSYHLYGHNYHTLGSSHNYFAKGLASWYGPGFQSHETASGERYNMYKLTAAHKTLPLSSVVQVTNLSNGRSVVVRVNDRGPFVGNRLIDLSYAAAKQIGMVNQGVARVSIKAL